MKLQGTDNITSFTQTIMARLETRIHTMDSRFSYDARTRIICAEASDIRFRLERLYDDACDMGTTLRGKHSDVRFVLEDTIMSGEDVAAWVLAPIEENKDLNVRLHILND